MKGTAILFSENQQVTFFEDIEPAVYKEIKKQCSCGGCGCSTDKNETNLQNVSPVFWHEDEIDWDYGY
ncbi:hypothetical protein [Bacillus sp. T33-2]|uniref:hypothetical protein n=1 Tax=Bacillus sp. T33-2 TaxID=2054168 RepID=UPI000C76FEC3|nr:hypothetical protein [Bacillus sp. T33-2]PLR97478.1 hypothetical protein CVD19_08285 [Bacillus sp. T33-2]